MAPSPHRPSLQTSMVSVRSFDERSYVEEQAPVTYQQADGLVGDVSLPLVWEAYGTLHLASL